MVPKGYRAYWSSTKDGTNGGVGFMIREDWTAANILTHFETLTGCAGYIQNIRIKPSTGPHILISNIYAHTDAKLKQQMLHTLLRLRAR